MIPPARLQSAIELLDAMIPNLKEPKGKPADLLIGQYFKNRRYIGSKDRGAVSEMVYRALRHFSSLEWRVMDAGAQVTGRSLILALRMYHYGEHLVHLKQMFTGERYSPAALSDQDQTLLAKLKKQHDMPRHMPLYAATNSPEWLSARLKKQWNDAFEAELAALNQEASVDIRVNTLKTTREALLVTLTKAGFEPSACPMSPVGIRLAKRGPLFATESFKAGHFEMQDEGSQIAALLTDAKPGQFVVDFCCGAGGKTLALAAQMENKGRLFAWDVSAPRMSDLAKRLKRAGVHNVQAHTLSSEADPFIKRHKGKADRVLVDAPCSGSGTWRRNPDLKWRFNQESLDELKAIQMRILDSAARLVAPGGRLIYVTCSILNEENNQQVDNFLHNRNDFKLVPINKIWDKAAPLPKRASEFLQLSPHQDGTDGFFTAVLERIAA